jgi:uncharacterized protein (TIGR03435 family)
MLLIRTLASTGLFMAIWSVMNAQSTTKSAAFDVASVRPNTTGVNSSSINRSGGRITLENTSLRECIAFAYGIADGRDYELSGPDWLDGKKFDIAAIFPPETSRDRVREMLRALLAERFGLKTHTENKKLQSYALVIAKRGPKLQAGVAGSDGAFTYAEDHVTVRAFSLQGFADRLSGPVFKLDRPVVDMTGIKGVYDFTLNWAPDGALADGHSGASIFTALKEQLGLKLEARKIVFKIVVVDHVDKDPSIN